MPNILYRNSREHRQAEGCKGFKERAKERAKDINRNHKPNPLPDNIGKALDELVSDALRLMKK